MTGRGVGVAAYALTFTLPACSALIVCAAVASTAQTRRPANRPPAPPSTRHSPQKAIFEPVYYPHDVDIGDVFFVDPETGWVSGHHRTPAGEGGFIVATRDGGRTWSVQFGNAAAAHAVTRMFFIDAMRGWAAQSDGTLLRTTNGSTWTRIGGIRPDSPLVFVAPERGFTLGDAGVGLTTDAGRTWTEIHRCRATFHETASSDARECELAAMTFAPDRATGFVVSRPIDGMAACFRSTDSGATWTQVSRIAGVGEQAMSLAFPDAATGFLRIGALLKRTTDGGHTWQTVSATVPDGPSIVQARGSVGWMVGRHDFSYTLDRGLRWIARRVDFPADVVRFTVVDTGTGYVVGSHGMVYRYRVVPFDYSVPHMLTIPGMTTFVPDGGGP